MTSFLCVVTVDKSKDRTRMLKLDEDEFLEVTDDYNNYIVLYVFCFASAY